MKIHNLKIREEYLDRLIQRQKTFEVRLNDRDYQVGDILKFEDENIITDKKSSTPNEENVYKFKIIYLTHLFPWTDTNHVVLGVEPYYN